MSARKLRIAVWHNLTTGGAKRALFDQVAGLVARGHYVESWCPPTADQTHMPLSSHCRENVLPMRSVHRVKPRRFSEIFAPYKERRERVSAMDEHCLACAEQINKGSFDLLFANISTFFQSTAIGRFTRIPSVFYLPEPARWLYEAQPCQRWMSFVDTPNRFWAVRFYHWLVDLGELESRRMLIRAEIENARAFSRILVNSHFSRESVLRAYGLDSTVSYLGIDCQRFRPTGEPREEYVIALGGLHHAKGPDRAIKALSTIEKAKRPKLVWVGNVADPEYASQITKMAHDHGVEFELQVMIGDDELVSLLSRARCMIYTSRLEPFGLAPLEANACGTPTVTLAEGGVRETIIDAVNGFLVRDNKPEELGSRIARLAESRELADELGQRARRHILENWDFERSIEILLSHFVDALDMFDMNNDDHAN